MDIKDWAYDDLGVEIWEKKYQHEDETFDEWLDRVSGGDSEVRYLIESKKFLFGGRILANRGLQNKGLKVSYSNCHVNKAPEDNIESIFDVAKETARTFSYGGGVGLSLSLLAPRGAKIHNAAKTTTGAVSFMDLYSMVSELIGQSGRRGALMLSLDSWHPDLEEFIEVKSDLEKITKANISIKAHDDFMRAAIRNENYTLAYCRAASGELITKVVNAREMLRKIAEMNWKMGEPGMLFWDTIQKNCLTSEYQNIEYSSTNPCGELPLPDYGSCLLGSINLAAFVDNQEFNMCELARVVNTAVIALNDVLDEGIPLLPLEKQRQMAKDWRSIGLGVMGTADMFIKMGMKYGSEKANSLLNDIGLNMAATAINTSHELALLHNKPFPKFDQDATVKSGFYIAHKKYIKGENEQNRDWLYNSQLLTCAPTGSISTMIGVSGGIEPIFANSYIRKTESLNGQDEYHKVYTKVVKEYMADNSCKEEDLPDYFVTAEQIKPIDRIYAQAAMQGHIDSSISSTINLPEHTSVETIMEIYQEAWVCGLKGVTVYRENCDRAGILTKETRDKTAERGKVIQVGNNVVGKKRKLMTGCGSLHCLTFFDKNTGDLLETYLNKGSTGGCNNFMIGLSRMMSLAARAGATVEDIIDQLESTGVCPSYAVRTSKSRDTSPGSCCPMAVAKALREMSDEMKEEISTNGDEEPVVSDQDNVCLEVSSGDKKEKCPECGNELIHSGGCMECRNCGYSKCN